MAMIQRMAGSDPMTAGALPREIGVPQTTLSRWLRQASVVGGNTTIGFLRDYSGVKMTNKSSPETMVPYLKGFISHLFLDISQ
jgi:hypothetical protein